MVIDPCKSATISTYKNTLFLCGQVQIVNRKKSDIRQSYILGDLIERQQRMLSVACPGEAEVLFYRG